MDAMKPTTEAESRPLDVEEGGARQAREHWQQKRSQRTQSESLKHVGPPQLLVCGEAFTPKSSLPSTKDLASRRHLRPLFIRPLGFPGPQSNNEELSKKQGFISHVAVEMQCIAMRTIDISTAILTTK